MPTPNVQIRRLPIDAQYVMGKFAAESTERAWLSKTFKKIGSEMQGYSNDIDNVYDYAVAAHGLFIRN